MLLKTLEYFLSLEAHMSLALQPLKIFFFIKTKTGNVDETVGVSVQ